MINHTMHMLQKLRTQKPLVLNLTNHVVMNTTANALLAVGASPIVTESRHEIPELMKIAQGVVFNLGTLNESFCQRLIVACDAANDEKRTVVLDPVGAGATSYRLETALTCLKRLHKVVIRCNASEALALVGMATKAKGVDSADDGEQSIHAAQILLQTYPQCQSVIISGAVDRVVLRTGAYLLRHGSHLMAQVTGMGCTHSALTAAFCAIGDTQAFTATAIMGLAGDEAALKAKGPGSFSMYFFDALASLDPDQIANKLRIDSFVSDL
jgi:hydroxyethylthiazole kinase